MLKMKEHKEEEMQKQREKRWNKYCTSMAL